MMPIRFVAMATADVEALRAGKPDANGTPAESHVTPVEGYPCRHCMEPMAAGEALLIAAHRPFPAPQPYAEVGPIFLHGSSCQRGGGTATIPAFLRSPTYIVRGYGADDRIVYGTGGVIETAAIPQRAEQLFANPAIAYLHVRSASNNCFHCRIERA